MDAELPRGARATFGLAFVLMILGSCGALRGSQTYEGPTPLRQEQLLEENEGVLGERAVEREVLLAREPARRPLAVMNIAISVLLLVAGGALLQRRRWSRWLSRQALGANMLLDVVSVTSTLLYWSQVTEPLTRTFEHPDLGEGSSRLMMIMTAMLLALTSALLVFVQGILFWRLGRDDVRAFVDAQPSA